MSDRYCRVCDAESDLCYKCHRCGKPFDGDGDSSGEQRLRGDGGYEYHVRISAPDNPEHFAVLIDSLEKGDKIVWNGRSEPFTITETAPHNGPGLDGVGQFKKTLRLENQTRENGAEFRLRFEEGTDHSLSPGSSGWDARCVVQRQIGDRAVNDGGWGRCTDVESLAHVNPVESAERDGEREVATDGGSSDLEGLSTHDLVGKALGEHDDQEAMDGIPKQEVVGWIVKRTELTSADVHDAIGWLHDRGHVYEPKPDHLRRTDPDDGRWLAVAWHEALVETRVEAGDLDPRYLVDRYGAGTPDEVEQLAHQGHKEVIRGDNEKLTLDDLDAAEEKLEEAGYEAVTDGGVDLPSSVTHQSDHGELKRRLAHRIGSDPSRYAADIGTERHKRLLDEEITLICDRLGLGFLADESKQQRMDAVMLKLGRDHRTGAQTWDTSDLVAVVRALQPDADPNGGGSA